MQSPSARTFLTCPDCNFPFEHLMEEDRKLITGKIPFPSEESLEQGKRYFVCRACNYPRNCVEKWGYHKFKWNPLPQGKGFEEPVIIDNCPVDNTDDWLRIWCRRDTRDKSASGASIQPNAMGNQNQSYSQESVAFANSEPIIYNVQTSNGPNWYRTANNAQTFGGLSNTGRSNLGHGISRASFFRSGSIRNAQAYANYDSMYAQKPAFRYNQDVSTYMLIPDTTNSGQALQSDSTSHMANQNASQYTGRADDPLGLNDETIYPPNQPATFEYQSQQNSMRQYQPFNVFSRATQKKWHNANDPSLDPVDQFYQQQKDRKKTLSKLRDKPWSKLEQKQSTKQASFFSAPFSTLVGTVSRLWNHKTPEQKAAARKASRAAKRQSQKATSDRANLYCGPQNDQNSDAKKNEIRPPSMRLAEKLKNLKSNQK